MKHIFILLILIISLTGTAQNASNDFRNHKLPLEQRVDILLQQLTLDEKLAFMEHQNPAIERLDIPAYSWWNEALHGVARNGFATVYPEPIAIAATFDTATVEQMYALIGDEGRLKYRQSQNSGLTGDNTGITFFTPNINLFRDPRWGRGMETFGEDPFLTAQMGKACVNGLQGNHPFYFKTLACAKHFAVHSGPESIRHQFDAVVFPRDLWTSYLPAFETLVKETDLQQVMCGYNRLDGEPCCTNENLLVHILRDEWGYNGLFVTDCWALNDAWERDSIIPRHETYPTAEAAATAAFGSVIDLECGSGLQALKNAVQQGLIDEAIIDDHVRKILTARFRLGMFDPQRLNPYNKQPDTTLFNPMALQIAQESMVLLKNENDLLPLDVKKYKRIAVVGPNAADSVMLSGNYNGTPRHTVTILEGIRNELAKLPENERPELYFDTLCHYVDGLYKLPAEFDRKVNQCDLILFVGGLSPLLEGEQLEVDADGFLGGDRTSIELPRIQEGMLMKLKKFGKPIVFVLCSGSAVALDWEAANLDAILCAWYGGQQGGQAVADILFGKYNPGGKLPITFYSKNNELPPFESYNMSGRTYRFMTEKPLYPFGYGLSYTTFAYSEGSFNPINRTLSFTITNNGQRDGDEVAQLYLRNHQDKNGPVKTLVGFKRLHLKAGESQEVIFSLDEHALQTFNDNSLQFEWIPGTFTLFFGNQSMDVVLQ